MKAILEDKKIDIEFEIIKDKEINSYKNDYSQVVLNLITNSKDALILNKIEEPKIKIVLDLEEEKSILKVFDNAGGIDKKYSELIFDPYFTTKDKGSGIGLYMSKMIIETHFKGEIKAQNIEDGVVFLLKV
ncbi:ATP-binding protein [Aliarcobacter thereius]|uniref:histidine kinase n=2 Tax=Aliarcobacter thereius TaxID=544718 RepID=A0A5R9H193_9BACT|nr:ATP-binding protein [Aliarcobacter thereius]OCL94141.1 Sensor protein ZraS [Aliarcobacter thereius]OCL95542.1 Sensor protein ZraS [Aliarcobacter thereius LMG 24486]TLS72937.1 HAMP domain-containing histidine kinase [Aliarcobacter thereius]TLS91535.1 HAMP domain-containing histidine kinase [Aliarcobacter thereius]TLT08349.1 HAMP domain-containing histidine kinase [Aliarcobacter thereius]